MTTYVYPAFVRSLIANDFILAMYPMDTSIRTSTSMESAALVKAGPQVRVNPIHAAGRLDLRVQGSILFQGVTLSSGVTYYLMFSVHTNYFPATRILVENRLAYTAFTMEEAMSSNFLRVTYPDNLIAKI